MPDGSWVQHFPITGSANDRNHVPSGHPTVEPSQFSFGPELIVSPAQDQTEVAIRNAELVYVGYGIVAPEADWDDYKGLD